MINFAEFTKILKDYELSGQENFNVRSVIQKSN